MSRRSEGEGMCTITIDVRNPAPESNPHKETGRYNRMEHVLTLMTILSELCGPGHRGLLRLRRGLHSQRRPGRDRHAHGRQKPGRYVRYEPCLCMDENGETVRTGPEGFCVECFTPKGYYGQGRPVLVDIFDVLKAIGEMVSDHVNEIMFDALAEPEDDCVLCDTGLAIGAWARFGVDDPFVPDGAVR